MPSPAESEYREVLYCGQSASIPGTLLYTSGELAYVRFRTRHWAGYGGFQNYVVTAIFREHLKFCEQQPQGTEAIPNLKNGQQAIEISTATTQQQQQQPESKPQASPPAVAKPVQPELSKGNLNGKVVLNAEQYHRSPAPVRTIGGLSLRDYLGNR